MAFRRPQLFPVLFIIGATALLATLGTWQLQRLEWKNAMIAQIEAASAKPALTSLPKSNEDLLYRHISLSGKFLHEKRFYLIAQPVGGQSGFYVITPLRLKDGRTVLVNRGWSPREKEALPGGVQKVEGVVRPLREKRQFSPENQVDKNIWFYEDLSAMSAAAGGPLLPYVIEQTSGGEGFPLPNSGKTSLRNDHLGYAITWFSLAFAGIIMFVLYHRDKPRTK